MIAPGLSVRQTEALVRQRMRPARVDTARCGATQGSRTPERLELELSERIGAPVSINFDGKSNGTVVIRYTTVDELEGILTHLR